MKNLFLTTLTLIFFQSHSQQKQPVIDMHMHAYSLGSLPAKEPNTGFLAPFSSEELRSATLEQYRKNNVVLAVTSGAEDSLYKKEAPTMIIRAIGFMGNENLKDFRQRIKEHDYKLLSESAPQYLGMDPSDERLDPFFELARELEMPIGLHMGLGPPGAAYIGMKDYRMRDSNPLLLEERLIEYPDLKIFICHAGWPFLDEIIGVLHAHPQVYVDISVINWALPQEEFYAYLKRLVQAGFVDRIMYGSDQMQWPQSISKSIDAIKAAPFLSEEQKGAILYDNAAKFLKLNRETIESHYNMGSN